MTPEQVAQGIACRLLNGGHKPFASLARDVHHSACSVCGCAGKWRYSEYDSTFTTAVRPEDSGEYCVPGWTWAPL